MENYTNDEKWACCVARYAKTHSRCMYGETKEWTKTIILDENESNCSWSNEQWKAFNLVFDITKNNWTLLKEYCDECNLDIKWHENVRLCIEKDYAYIRTDENEISDFILVRISDSEWGTSYDMPDELKNEKISKWFIYTP